MGDAPTPRFRYGDNVVHRDRKNGLGAGIVRSLFFRDVTNDRLPSGGWPGWWYGVSWQGNKERGIHGLEEHAERMLEPEPAVDQLARLGVEDDEDGPLHWRRGQEIKGPRPES